MTYAADIDALNPAHRYPLDGDALDAVGTNHGTNSGGVFTGTALCEGVTNAFGTNSVSDRVVLPSIATIDSVDQARKAVGGWFTPSALQNPPKSIYGEGGTTNAIRFILGWGNYLVYEVTISGVGSFQIFADVPLTPQRPYYLYLAFEGNGFGNEVRAYLDGVKQLNAEPTDRQPDTTVLPARSAGEFGDPAGTVAVGGTAVILLAPINGAYNEWAMWDGADAIHTDAQVREELFEKGTLADLTITNQAGLDAIADTLRADHSCCIRVDVVGDISLTADNVTFDPLASIHVQYNGTGTLTWTNTNGADASIGSTTGGGTIVFVNPSTLTINGLIAGTEVRVYDAGTTTEVAGIESSGTSFSQSINEASVDIRLYSLGYQNKAIKGVSMASDASINAGQLTDRQYENP